MTAAALQPQAGPPLTRRVASFLFARPRLFLVLLLAPPLLWLGVVYLGSMLALLVQSFFSIDEFTGMIRRELTLRTYAELFRPAHLDIIVRTATMAAAVTLAAAVVAWWPAFTLGAWGGVFFEQVLALWAAATAAFVIAMFREGSRRLPTPIVATLLLPSLWIGLSFLPIRDGTLLSDVVTWFGVGITFIDKIDGHIIPHFPDFLRL